MFTYILFTFLVVWLAIRLYFKLTINFNKSYTCLIGKTAIVTGANSGIGYWTALDFAKRGARVILACRNEEKAIRVKKEIIAATGNANVDYALIDLTSLKSVREFSKKIIESEERLDILVNNAGATNLGDKFTEDGLQILWQVNHFSGFLLTHLLMDKLQESAPSRIVMVSSKTAKMFYPSLKTVNKFDFTEHMNNLKIYSYTKAANILFIRELARRLPSGVNVYALHPGLVASNIWENFTGIKRIFHTILLNLWNTKTSEEGAQTSIYCAVSKDLNNETGKLYENCKEIPIYSTCLDMDFAKKLWEKCEDLVGLKPHEKIKNV